MRSTKREQSLENLVAQRICRVYTRSENADDSSFLLDAGYFRPATIFEGDSSRGFAAVLVRVCARWPTQRRRRRRRRRGTLRRPVHRKRTRKLLRRRFVRKYGFKSVHRPARTSELIDDIQPHKTIKRTKLQLFFRMEKVPGK